MIRETTTRVCTRGTLSAIPGSTASIHFRQACPKDAPRCHAIETSAYEGDEATTLEKIIRRIAHYPQGFWVMELDGRIAGFINSGCAHKVVMADEAFKDLVGHDPDAPNVVIMSVVVDIAHQGKGLSSPMVRTFVQRMRQGGKRSIHLMCRQRHIALYAHWGWRYIRPSASAHGGVAWHEMRMDLLPG